MMAIANKTPKNPSDKIENITEVNLDKTTIANAEVIPAPAPLEDFNLISVKREDTRGRLALFFLAGFFIILVIGMIIAGLSEGDKITGMKEMLLTISGVLSGPLGFVVGYYFRSREED